MALLRIRQRPDVIAAGPGAGHDEANRAVVRVLHVFGRLDRAGAELRTLEVLRATVNAPVHHEFICLSGQPGVLDDDFRAIGASIHYIPLSLRFPLRMARLLRERNIDVLHSHVHFFSGVLVTLAAVVGVPRRIVHFRSTHDGRPSTFARQLIRVAQRRLIQRYATDILAVGTGAMEAWSADWRNDQRCRVVLNGIDTAEFATAIGCPITRDEIGVGPHGPIVAFIGRFDQLKRPELALRAFAGMGPTAWFVCAGSSTPAERTSFEDLVKTIGVGDRTIVLGVRNDVARILALADVVVVTSAFEGLPGIVLEALAAGVSVVASRLPGTVEIAEHLEGITLVDPGASADVWAKHLERTVDTDCRSHGMPLRLQRHESFRRSPFTVENSARRLAEVWLS